MAFENISASKILRVFPSYVSANRNMIYGLEMCPCELPCKSALTEFSVLTSKIGGYTFVTKFHSKD